VRVKGKDKPVTIFEPLGTAEQLNQQTLDALNLYSEALKHYANQEWDAAETQFKNLDKAASHPLYELYLARIKQFKKTPPDKNWDGVYTYETK
jgi:adenylate cyclase